MARESDAGLSGTSRVLRDRQSIYVSKSRLVAATLRELIMTGDMQPGAPLRQRDLAEHFGVSPTPVREALRMLESEGLVTNDTHKGSTVAQPAEGGLQEKYYIRSALEGLAAGLAAPKVTSDDIADLAEYNRQLGHVRLSAAEFAEINQQFHFRIYEAARSPLLMSLLQLLWQSIPNGIQVSRPHKESFEEHNELLRALREGDGEAARRITEQHILGAVPHLSASPAQRAKVNTQR